MKKLFVIMIALSFFASEGKAQVQREINPSQNTVTNAGQKSERPEMKKSLNLTKEQTGQLKELHRSMKQKKEEVNNDAMLTPEQKETKMKELRLEQKEKLDSILTPEQMEKLKEERKNGKRQKGEMNKSDSTGSVLDN